MPQQPPRASNAVYTADRRAKREWHRLKARQPKLAQEAYAQLASGPPRETGWMYRCRGAGAAATVRFRGVDYEQWGLRLGDDANGVDVLFFFVDPDVHIKRVKVWNNGIVS